MPKQFLKKKLSHHVTDNTKSAQKQNKNKTRFTFPEKDSIWGEMS
jgi:hypothetical protein